jgi:hypothetical protein
MYGGILTEQRSRAEAAAYLDSILQDLISASPLDEVEQGRNVDVGCPLDGDVEEARARRVPIHSFNLHTCAHVATPDPFLLTYKQVTTEVKGANSQQHTCAWLAGKTGLQDSAFRWNA